MTQHKVKIFGAGSIGNHLANACRTAGWQVTVVDKDAAALKRMKEEIYPKRYGAWDEAIILALPQESPVGGYDAIFVGTPPDSHLPIATEVLRKEAPRVLQIEKPLCSPTLEGLDEFMSETKKHPETAVIVGFNHIVAENTLKTEELIRAGLLGKIQALDCEIRSNWQNILTAHPWLSGPEDTYLGYWKRGGGAGGEHIHALNLWQHFAHVVGAGRVREVVATVDYIEQGRVNYDRSIFMNLVTESGLVGRVAQDVITQPKKKFANLQFENGSIAWYNDISKTEDAVEVVPRKGDKQTLKITKTRVDEFLHEIRHIEKLLNGELKISDSPIRLDRGLESMLVLAAAHRSFAEKRTITVDYSIFR